MWVWGCLSRVKIKKTEGRDLTFNKNLRFASNRVGAGGGGGQRSKIGSEM